MKRIALYAAAIALMSMSAISCTSSSDNNKTDEQTTETAADDATINPDEAPVSIDESECQDQCCDQQAECDKADCKDCDKTEVAEAPKASAGVVNLSDDTKFRPDTKVSKVTVLDFNATWCVPCKKLAPAFKKAAEAYGSKAEFYSVDIEKNPETASAFGIQNVPTVVILSPKAQPQTFVGLGPFCTGSDQSPETIFSNITKIIDATLK